MEHTQHPAPGDDRYADVVVAGAGLAGLVAAVTAARAGGRVALLDVRSPGGRATSQVRDGFVLNQGPHALYARGPGAAVLRGLGVTTAGAPPHPVGAGAVGERVGLLPTSAGTLLRSPLVGPRAKVRLAALLARFARIDTPALAPLSAAGWVRSLGLPADGATLLATLLRVATYASDLEAVSADAAVRQLQLVLAGGVTYLHGGWSSLVDQLVAGAARAGVELVPDTRALALAPTSDGGWELATSAAPWRARAVVLALGGPEATRAVLPADPDWQLGADATAACLDLGLSRVPPTPLLFALDEPLYLSTHAPSARLAPEGRALVHVLRYGARTSEEDRPRLWRFAAQAGIRSDDVVVERFLHRMTVSHGLPVPGPGLAGR
ncbi:MAG TPA: FAD-dependent oxidoreductase, partial [Acidimicrobiales bacterium]|nr:FAD-dependent oxidoreductase [Acidimicrobiales bacterium]